MGLGEAMKRLNLPVHCFCLGGDQAKLACAFISCYLCTDCIPSYYEKCCKSQKMYVIRNIQ